MEFTHFDNKGQAVMVDVTHKESTHRVASATGKIKMSQECYDMVKTGGHRKGDVLNIARVAGIMATKRTFELIPLCHVLLLTKVAIEFQYLDDSHEIQAVCSVETVGQTGVEMEALTGISVSLLTIYDMCKAIDRSMEISDIYVVKKDGGKSGLFEHERGVKND